MSIQEVIRATSTEGKGSRFQHRCPARVAVPLLRPCRCAKTSWAGLPHLVMVYEHKVERQPPLRQLRDHLGCRALQQLHPVPHPLRSGEAEGVGVRQEGGPSRARTCQTQHRTAPHSAARQPAGGACTFKACVSVPPPTRTTRAPPPLPLGAAPAYSPACSRIGRATLWGTSKGSMHTSLAPGGSRRATRSAL